MSSLELNSLRKQYGEITAVENVSASIRDGELLCLLGPSGCGKSTTMRMIGGLIPPTKGDILMDGERVTELPPHRRDTSIVFQNWALFPHKTVIENVAFGLKMQGVEYEERIERSKELLETVRMDGYEDSDPEELSGGEKQRVALARSLAADPEVLLLDEPLSNLDKRLREQMQIELKKIHNDVKKTFIYVTHDQNEAFTLADRIGIMNDGNIVQIGPPQEVYNNPNNQFVESFLGDTNMRPAVVDNLSEESLLATLDTDDRIEIPGINSTDGLTKGDKINISLRPETLNMQPIAQTAEMQTDGSTNRLLGEVQSVIHRGSSVRYNNNIGEKEMFVEFQANQDPRLEAGDKVELSWDGSEVLAFHGNGKRVGGET